MSMLSEAIEPPRVLPSHFLLDDLELIRQGVDVSLSVGTDPLVIPQSPLTGSLELGEVVLIEPEGVPIAAVRVQAVREFSDTYNPDAVLRFISPRPDRPFESLHRTVASLAPPDITVVVDHSIDADDVGRHLPAGASLLILIVAAIERDGETQPRDVLLCRRAGRLSDELRERFALTRVDLAVVPIALDHPHRRQRIDACAATYGRAGMIVDLTGPCNEFPKDFAGGTVLFFTGLSGSGKSTLAKAVRNSLLERPGQHVTLIDGDVVRRHLSSELGFTPADRDINIRRIGWVAARIAEHGGLAICSPIAPFEATRQAVQEMTLRAGGRFVLIHVATPLAECERRDRKGLYARARRGEIPDFTGISSPYEEPRDPDLRLDTTNQDINELTQRILEFGASRGLWPEG